MAYPEAISKMHVKCRKSLNLANDNDLVGLIAAIYMLPEKPHLIVLDPLRDLHQADENSSTEMADIMRRIRALRDILGCTILFTHHSAKSNKDTRRARGGQQMRGSSVVHATVDAGLYLQDLDTNGETYWQNTVEVETRAGRGAGNFSLRLDIVDDANRHALEASWTCSKNGPEKKGNNGDDLLSKKTTDVKKVLRNEWIKSPSKPMPLAKKTVRHMAGGAMDTVETVLAPMPFT